MAPSVAPVMNVFLRLPNNCFAAGLITRLAYLPPRIAYGRALMNMGNAISLTTKCVNNYMFENIFNTHHILICPYSLFTSYI